VRPAHATAAVDQAVFISGADRPSIIHGLARITLGVGGMLVPLLLTGHDRLASPLTTGIVDADINPACRPRSWSR
jgi:hypothetical protein